MGGDPRLVVDGILVADSLYLLHDQVVSIRLAWIISSLSESA
jgi:hypothetical protein